MRHALRLAMLAALAICLCVPAARAQPSDVLFYPTFSAPPDSVLIDGVNVGYVREAAIAVPADTWIRLEAFRAGARPIRVRERFAAGSEPRPHYTFRLAEDPLYVIGEPNTTEAANWVVPSLAAISFAATPVGEWDYYREAAALVALVRGAYGMASTQERSRERRRYFVMGGWMRQDFRGASLSVESASTQVLGFEGADGTVLEPVQTAIETRGGVSIKAPRFGSNPSRLSQPAGLSGQIGLRVWKRLGLRLSYHGHRARYSGNVGVGLANTYGGARGEGGREAKRVHHTVDAMGTLRVVTILGNTLGVGGGAFVRFSRPFEIEAGATPTFVVGSDPGGERFAPGVGVSIRGHAETAVGGAWYVSLETQLSQRLAFVTQYRVYRHLGTPHLEVTMHGDGGTQRRTEPQAHLTLWSSGFQIAL